MLGDLINFHKGIGLSTVYYNNFLRPLYPRVAHFDLRLNPILCALSGNFFLESFQHFFNRKVRSENILFAATGLVNRNAMKRNAEKRKYC